MRRSEIGKHKGITDIDLMAVLGIIGILAAIVVPFHTGYVERARVTEATDIMEAIITSQKEEKKGTIDFFSVPLADGMTNVTAFMARGIVVSDTKFFTYETATTTAKPNDGFTVTATSTFAFGIPGGTITYTYDPIATPRGSWAADGTIILNDMLPTQH
ncbi:MAG: type IV pilin protein [Planctomycetota bacterium]|jgi:Tfp pilus assembly protein PilE